MDRRSAIRNTGLLAGASVTLPTFLSLLQSCKRETRLDWEPEFFTRDEAKTISTLVDMILPRTETPGALDVKVDIFIDKVIARTYEEQDQEAMRKAIADFNEDCLKNHGSVFNDLNESEKIKVLEAAEKSSGKFNPGIWGITIGNQEPVGFYRSMKAVAIWAYFTSREIGEGVLSYDPIPGNYNGCLPVKDVGNKWSL
ncbi:gluconate 2-dehydrogenase subunit 3 family protein [Poritiphilus flavus]|uniref:Gluconate 2-dehydrogenase subunit 3 family protein n=1 Tax=Poritiphilus flavus TaxID=2697053 RepID=A0A6L9EAK4_9FLAO|nr:gluconate 2-dehydrogenase subunit 3 family protein [Poritiphilus flavus]NAS11489.1 gluconate 2-dehydrogenase subunit 3 family protein [Poritiphilus flavus]